MQIVCPACDAAYEVPMTLLKPGQAVRCARCAREWVPSPTSPEQPSDLQPEPASADASAPELSPEAVRRTRRAPRRSPMAQPVAPRPSVMLRLAWAASIIAALLLLWGAYAQRTTIMQLWPPSIRLYAALGLAARP